MFSLRGTYQKCNYSPLLIRQLLFEANSRELNFSLTLEEYNRIRMVNSYREVAYLRQCLDKSRIKKMVSQDQIIDKLRECLDPELGVNIVDLGLIYGVMIEGSKINVLMTMTTPGCPLDSYFVRDITSKLKTLKGISDVAVEMTFDPPWAPSKMSQESKDLLGFVN